ncbi:MAG: hypothetical protein IK024_06165 [Treponema sp.]|nr:hypothetical protein [Treponema sp.]
MKNYFKLILLIFLFSLVFMLSCCKFFEDPKGSAQLLSVYTSEDEYKQESTNYYVRYINGTLKISNTGSIDIYNSTISLSAESSERQYFKTVSFDITLKPGSSIYIPVEFNFDTRLNGKSTEKWKVDSMKIIGEAWK